LTGAESLTYETLDAKRGRLRMRIKVIIPFPFDEDGIANGVEVV
jgi:hypothetical protein